MRYKKTTQAEIAGKLGISQTTVSLAINHPESSKVSPEVRDAVIDFCRRQTPGMLSQNRNWNIGYLLSGDYTLSSPYYRGILSGVERAAGELGYNVIVESYRNGANLVRRKNIDGLLLSEYYLLQKLRPDLGNLPHVLLNNVLRFIECDAVGQSAGHALMMLVQHLYDLHHRKIAFVSFYFADSATPPGVYSHTELRTNAFRSACRNFSLSEQWVLSIPFGPKADDASPEQKIELTRQKSAEALDTLLAMPDKPTAIITGDIYAFEMLRTAARYHIDVPRQLSIAGIDNLDEYNNANPFLSSVDNAFEAQGELAVKTLHNRIRHPEQPFMQITCPVSLHIRQSCAIPCDNTNQVTNCPMPASNDRGETIHDNI